jgi:zinc/manganese transport system permease protein
MISGVGAGFISAFWSNGPVRVALAVGGGAAVVCAVVGLSTVMRRQSFAGHALADISGAGGSAGFFGWSAPATRLPPE